MYVFMYKLDNIVDIIGCTNQFVHFQMMHLAVMNVSY